jgi:hypothetical protein
MLLEGMNLQKTSEGLSPSKFLVFSLHCRKLKRETRIIIPGFPEGEKAVIRFALETTKNGAASDDAHASRT